MGPAFNTSGLLPAGTHDASWDEISEAFGWNERRAWLLKGLRRALEALLAAGCKEVYLDGSFVTAKDHPNDFDACWSVAGVDATKIDPVLLDFGNKRLRQKLKYGGELFPASTLADSQTMQTYLDFFQTHKDDGSQKGIIRIDLGSLS